MNIQIDKYYDVRMSKTEKHRVFTMFLACKLFIHRDLQEIFLKFPWNSGFFGISCKYI